MTAVYALLVGVNEYRATSIAPLKGAINDIHDVRDYLDESVGDQANVLTLLNQQATRAAIIDGFRHHLGRAKTGDTALFWYSGHGSTQVVPPHWWHVEAGGTQLQTIVCADSRTDGQPDLLDKELAILVREVTAQGPHVVLVLDCCHSGGTDRAGPSARARQAEPATVVPDPAMLLIDVRGSAGGGVPLSPHDVRGYVSLAACQPHELAYEMPLMDPGGTRHHRGVFSTGLLAELRRPGEARSYRQLTAAARAYVENAIDRQTPDLHPAVGTIADQPFLGGPVRPPATTMTLRQIRGQWEVDAGRCHGLGAGSPAEDIRVAIHQSTPDEAVREARVVRVHAAHSLVEPLGWVPADGQTYPVVLSKTLLPDTTVAVGGGAGDDETVARRVAQLIGTAGPGGGPSPYLRLVRPDDTSELARLRVRTPAGDQMFIEGPGGIVHAYGSMEPDHSGRPSIVAALEHIARWRLISRLQNPLSRLAGSVELQVIRPQPTDFATPFDRPGQRIGASGAIEVEYEFTEHGFAPPSMYIRLDNRSDRRLHCVLLDLTDRFRIHTSLFPGGYVEPRASVAAGDGDLIELALPADQEVRPHAHVRDWLMLVVSEDKINSAHFALPPLGEPAGTRAHDGSLIGIVERLALTARFRDVERKPSVARDWWTTVVPVVTTVPGPVGGMDRSR